MNSENQRAILLLDDESIRQQVFQKMIPKVLKTEKYEIIAPIFSVSDRKRLSRFRLDDQKVQEAREMIYRNKHRIDLVLADADLGGLSLREFLEKKNHRYFVKEEVPFILWTLGFDNLWGRNYRSIESKQRLLQEQSNLEGGINFVDCMQKEVDSIETEIEKVVSQYIIT